MLAPGAVVRIALLAAAPNMSTLNGLAFAVLKCPSGTDSAHVATKYWFQFSHLIFDAPPWDLKFVIHVFAITHREKICILYISTVVVPVI